MFVIGYVGYAQQKSPVFLNDQPLEIAFEAELSKIKHEDEDSIYFPSVMSFKNADGTLDSVRIGIRARGNFRRKHCTLPPLRIKIHKEDRKGMFAGVKSMKLVLPCQDTKVSNELILREYLCYQLYEPITPYVLSTRLVNISLTETSRKTEVLNLVGFLIEDDDDAARRLGSKVVNSDKVSPFMLQDTCAIRFDLFQFMIGNTDFSTAYFHNTKVFRTKANVLIPVAYDFDMSGIVSAPYATVNPDLGIDNVRQRVYRGFCRGDGVAASVRSEYLANESVILSVLDKNQSLFSEKEMARIKKYMNDFFSVMRSDNLYKQRIAQACRTTN